MKIDYRLWLLRVDCNEFTFIDSKDIFKAQTHKFSVMCPIKYLVQNDRNASNFAIRFIAPLLKHFFGGTITVIMIDIPPQILQLSLNPQIIPIIHATTLAVSRFCSNDGDRRALAKIFFVWGEGCAKMVAEVESGITVC